MLSAFPEKPIEVIETHMHSVACNGGGGALGHPRVWLHLDSENHTITCPYCSRTYKLSTAHGHAA